MTETVLVTGGTGYVGGWVIVELLKRGYTVRTTVRSLSKEAAVRTAVGKQIDPGDRLSFAAADLGADAGWDAAIAGCAYVLHVASPLGSGNERDPDAFVRPAREGTLRVLRSAVKAGVKRVVLTSSCGAATPATMGVNTVTDEETWSDPSKQEPYRRSKTLAEKAAWDFMKSEGGATELTTILPSGVFGPVLSQEGLGSVQFIQRIFDGRLPRIPNVGLNIIDVRDLADLHVALLEPGRGPRRYMAGGQRVSVDQLAKMIGRATDRTLAVVPVPDVALRTAGRVFAVVGPFLPFETPINSAAMQYYTQMPASDDAPSTRDFGLHWRDPADTIADTAAGLRQVGRL